jgi:prepilin-type N-terminal cleavage/methylation domain-containing protein
MIATWRRLRERSRADDGFTLVELLLAISILGIVVAPIGLAMMTSLSIIGRSEQRFTDSRSSLIAAAYFSNDVASARAIQTDDAAACGGGTAVISLSWADASGTTTAPVNNEVSYVMDAATPTNKKLVRRYCANGTVVTNRSNAAVSLGPSPTVSCFAAGNVVDATCGPSTRRVQMLVTAAPNSPISSDQTPTPYSFVLVGTRRST